MTSKYSPRTLGFKNFIFILGILLLSIQGSTQDYLFDGLDEEMAYINSLVEEGVIDGDLNSKEIYGSFLFDSLNSLQKCTLLFAAMHQAAEESSSKTFLGNSKDSIYLQYESFATTQVKLSKHLDEIDLRVENKNLSTNTGDVIFYRIYLHAVIKKNQQQHLTNQVLMCNEILDFVYKFVDESLDN